MAIEKIAIADLERTKLQTRLQLSSDTVDDYADAMRNKAKFPPVTVFADAEKDTLWLADGFHRVAAAEMDGYKFVKADVRAGTFADALKFALGANANHGLRRSNADKKHTLEMAWENRRELWPREDGADPSAAVLSEACGISLGTVNRFLAEVEPISMREVHGANTSQKQAPDAPAEPSKKSRGKPPVRKNAPPPPPPVRKVFGKDGKVRPVAPTAAPVRKSAPPQGQGRCCFMDAEGFCTNEKMQGGGFKCIGCENKRVSPTSTLPSYNHAKGVMTDRFGVEIPMAIAGAFKAETVRDVIESHLRHAANLLKGAMDEKDPSVAQFRQADLIDIQNAVRTAKFTKPHCVCRICQGNGRGSCTACHETGFQTQAQYDNNPKEFKA